MVVQDNYNKYNFGDFVDTLLINLENYPIPSHLDDEFSFMMGNIYVHNTPYAMHIIHGRESNNLFLL